MWQELVRRDYTSEHCQMEVWAAELAANAVADAASTAAALPSAASATTTAALGTTPLALPAGAGAGRVSEWNRLYASLW